MRKKGLVFNLKTEDSRFQLHDVRLRVRTAVFNFNKKEVLKLRNFCRRVFQECFAYEIKIFVAKGVFLDKS